MYQHLVSSIRTDEKAAVY